MLYFEVGTFSFSFLPVKKKDYIWKDNIWKRHQPFPLLCHVVAVTMATGVCAKAAFNRSSALHKLRGTEITVGSRLKEVVFRLKSSIDLFLKRKLRFIYCPLFKECTRSLNEVIDYPSVVCLLTLPSKQMKIQSDLPLTAILNPLRDLWGQFFLQTQYAHSSFSPHRCHGDHGPPLASSASVS